MVELEETMKKRFTDCVYFLASPLTCIKGIECEYRHSEIARLNPRDCWYWLAGSCHNPSCAFRHPPLDVHTDLSFEHAPSEDQCHTSTKKVEVPCYFYFNGFCKKGDSCSFLHGSNETLKVSNTAPAISDAPQVDNKTSTGSNMVSATIEKVPILSEAAPKVSSKTEVKPPSTKSKSEEKRPLKNIKAEEKQRKGIKESEFKCQTASPHTSTSEFVETSIEGSIKSEAVMYTDQSSEEEVDAHSREDDWIESSPGFDVLVDDRSHNMGYEDEDYLVGIERDGGELDGHFLGYNYPESTEYAEDMHQERRIDSCVEFDDDIDEQRINILSSMSRYDSEMMNPCSIRRRNFLPGNLPMDDLRAVDLRSYLGNNRVEDDPRLPCFSERNHSSVNRFGSHENSRQYDRKGYNIGTVGNNKRRFKAAISSNQVRQSYPTISRQHYKRKRQSKRPVYSSDLSKRPVTKKRVTEEYSVFSGPKTLDQIKGGKRRGTASGNSYGNSYSNSGSFSKKSEDFEGPKPLSEILKDKRKLRSVVDVNYGIS